MAIDRLVVGLGNPGEEYQGTRHNVGFDVVNRLAKTLSVRFERFRARGDSGKTLGRCAEDSERSFALLEPATFMNLSGVAVQAARERLGVPSSSILVICDDFHLALGRLRVRPKGSAGGHNGLRSIIGSLASEEFPRVRIGIGDAPGQWQDFVLSRFTREEKEIVEPAVGNTAAAVAKWCLDGDFDRLMNTLNAPSNLNNE